MNTTGTAPYYVTCFAWNTNTVPVYVDYLTVDIVHHGSLQELAGYQPEIISTSDYYTFGGGGMPGRTFNSQEARYGFNGQEKDDEIANGMYSAEFWEYDSRIGRRWNTDPVVYPWQSPYATFNNNPVYFSDPSGLEGTKGDDKGKKKNTLDHPEDFKEGDIYNYSHGRGKHRVTSQWILEVENGKKVWKPTGQMTANLDEVVITTKRPSLFDKIAKWWRETDETLEGQQNKNDWTPPVKNNSLSGIMPLGSGPNKNNSIQGGADVESQENDGIYGYYPGSILAGLKKGELVLKYGTGIKGKSAYGLGEGTEIVGGFKDLFEFGSTYGEGVDKYKETVKDEKKDKPILKIATAKALAGDSMVFRPWSYKQGTQDTFLQSKKTGEIYTVDQQIQRTRK